MCPEICLLVKRSRVWIRIRIRSPESNHCIPNRHSEACHVLSNFSRLPFAISPETLLVLLNSTCILHHPANSFNHHVHLLHDWSLSLPLLWLHRRTCAFDTSISAALLCLSRFSSSRNLNCHLASPLPFHFAEFVDKFLPNCGCTFFSTHFFHTASQNITAQHKEVGDDRKIRKGSAGNRIIGVGERSQLSIGSGIKKAELVVSKKQS